MQKVDREIFNYSFKGFSVHCNIHASSQYTDSSLQFEGWGSEEKPRSCSDSSMLNAEKSPNQHKILSLPNNNLSATNMYLQSDNNS